MHLKGHPFAERIEKPERNIGPPLIHPLYKGCCAKHSDEQGGFAPG